MSEILKVILPIIIREIIKQLLTNDDNTTKHGNVRDSVAGLDSQGIDIDNLITDQVALIKKYLG